MEQVNYFSEFNLSENYFTDINEYIENVSRETSNYSLCYQRKRKSGYYVYNIPCSFDIETTSFYKGKQKQAIMYIWQFCFNGYCVVGRTWESFLYLCKELKRVLELSEHRRLYVYVHNLSFEFQFFRKYFTWENVFAVDERKPIKALTSHGIEFRDSYILSGYSLENTAKHLTTYKIQKKTGDLQYDVIRNSKTELTEKEILYCIYDVLVVVAYIQEQINEYGNITKIPMTNTGRVRNYCRNKCFMDTGYRWLISRLTLETEEYKLLKMAFQGGFTHSNPYHTKVLCEDVTSYDFTSSYPYCIISEKYPMSKGRKFKITSKKQYNLLSEKYLMIHALHMEGITPKVYCDYPLSLSKCYNVSRETISNGRIAYADKLDTVCTNIDLEIYVSFYNIKHISIGTTYIYEKDYLPKQLIECVLDLYGDKTSLKGVQGRETEYLHSKGMLNSIYGMMVTDIVRDETAYINDRWSNIPADNEEQIEKYNKNKNRFLYYPWGVFVTAYARKNLFSGILECQNDYIYSDTDSIKIFNADKHKTYFDNYNLRCIQKMKEVSNKYHIDFNKFKPKTMKGIEKPLGVWDFDGHYKYFKTLGSKRYLVYDGDNLHSTVSGCGKSLCNYLLKQTDDIKECFELFDDGLYIPNDFTDKLTHTYIDDIMEGEIRDIQGHTEHYYQKSGIHLSPCDFDMSIARSFIDFLKGVQFDEKIL